MVYIKFCSEGDNVPDAVMMMTKLNDWLNLVGISGIKLAYSLVSVNTEWLNILCCSYKIIPRLS